MVKKILGFLVLIIVALCVFVQTRPATYHIERSASVAAPPEVVFAQINDFHKWRAWSPWEDIDPAMERTFGGSDSGVGATYGWSSKKAEEGTGKMTITECQPASKVAIKLEFIKPFEDTSAVAFTIAPDGAGSRVTWAMDGDMNFLSKAMCLITPMDKMIGPSFEKGLAAMKTVSESAAQQPAGAATDSTKSTP
jgi:carbon monoxide dehydrogenase subunit G